MGDPTGTVPTASSPTLVLTLLVDRSQAEPGEEIKTIEVALPPGFAVTVDDVGAVKIEDAAVPFRAETSANAVRFVLDREIDNFLSSVIEIDFVVRTPDAPTAIATFGVILRSLSNAQIGDFVKPGEIDGNPANNNDYTLQVVPNIPPDAPTGVGVVADPDGENDALVSWNPVPDRDVQGYFVFRGDGATLEALGGDTVSFRDVDAPIGANEYSVAAFKSRLVVSERSSGTAVIVPPDTKAPNPVLVFSVAQDISGLRVVWRPSESPDVVRYDLVFGLTGGSSELLDSRFADDLPEVGEFEFVHRQTLSPGRYIYGVLAVDENENVSPAREFVLALLDRPNPNPFTPLGAAPFNTVKFPTRAVADAVGDLVVRVYDLHGRQIWESAPSTGDVEWDGRRGDGTLAAGGVYAYQMELGGQFRIGSIVLVR
ncbi:hypothetical protein HOI71_28965 [Candidatus Poribacteria bacterium]|nr:hypothetical protein [Candidatus Poribacteria bacterium]